MTDDKGREALFLGHAHYRHSTLSDLTYAAGCRADLGVIHGLNGVDYHYIRLKLISSLQNLSQTSFGEDIDLLLINTEALCAHFELTLAFLAGDIQYFLLTFD